MKKFYTGALTLISASAALIACPHVANAGPYPDRPGVCYFFRGETLEIMEPCVLSPGHGAGVHYVGLTWSDGVRTTIWTKVPTPRDPNIYYTVDDAEADRYERDVFYQETATRSDDNLVCYRVRAAANSVCYQ